MIHWFVITGMLSTPKNQLAQYFAAHLQQAGQMLTLLDNNDAPLLLADVPRQRLVGGCVCCSLAGNLIPLISRTTTPYGILTVSAQADSEALDRVLHSLRNAQRRMTAIALLDAHTQTHAPYLAAKLTLYAQYTLREPYPFDELLPLLP
jgi:hypothetical protein